jgi:Protein of unknown function (DUF2568)
MLAAPAYWGFTNQDAALQWVFGLGAPLLVATLWGRFMSLKASQPTTDPCACSWRSPVRSGVAVLFAAGEPTLGLCFAALVLAHMALTFALGQRPAARR